MYVEFLCSSPLTDLEREERIIFITIMIIFIVLTLYLLLTFYVFLMWHLRSVG